MSLRQMMQDKLDVLDFEIIRLKNKRVGLEFVIKLVDENSFTEQQIEAVFASYGYSFSRKDLSLT